MKKFLSISLLASVIFLYGCSSNKLTSLCTLGEGARIPEEKNMIKEVCTNPQTITFFQNEKQPITIDQSSMVRLDDDSLGYLALINGDQNFKLLIHTQSKTTFKKEKNQVFNCSSGTCPLTGEEKEVSSEVLIPTTIEDIIITQGTKETIIKGQSGSRSNIAKVGP